MEQKLKQDIQIGETIRSLRMERKTDAGPGGFQTAAYGSRHHPEHLLSDRRRYLQHPHLGPCWSVPDLSGGL